MLRAFEADPPERRANPSGRQHKFEVLLTTYELILKDAHVLGKVRLRLSVCVWGGGGAQCGGSAVQCSGGRAGLSRGHLMQSTTWQL